MQNREITICLLGFKFPMTLNFSRKKVGNFLTC